MKTKYKNKMIIPDNKTIELIPKYIGGVELDFHINGKVIRVNNGDLLPELSIKRAKQRPDFVIIKRELK